MKDDVTQRLGSFGYTIDTQSDDWALNFVIQKATDHIKNSCNIASIPEELHSIAVDMAVGEFLKGKKASGQLDAMDVLNSEAISTIKLGDTQINYSEEATPSQMFDGLIAFLMKGNEAELVSYRQMKW